MSRIKPANSVYVCFSFALIIIIIQILNSTCSGIISIRHLPNPSAIGTPQMPLRIQRSDIAMPRTMASPIASDTGSIKFFICHNISFFKWNQYLTRLLE